MIQASSLSIFTALGLTFVIDWYLFDFLYDEVIFREMRIFKKWKPSWTTVVRFFLITALLAAVFTVIFHWQYSRTTTLTNSEAWLSSLDVAWAHLVLVFSIAFSLVFVMHSVVTLGILIFQARLLDGMIKMSPELAGTTGKDDHYETRALLTVPFLKAPKSRVFVLSWLFPTFLFHCGSAILVLWNFLDIVAASVIAYPLTYWVLRRLFVDTMDVQVILFGSFDPNLGWQYATSTFRFALLSSHVTTTANWFIQQPVIASIMGFLGLLATAIISLATIKKAVEGLREKTENSEKEEEWREKSKKSKK